MSFLRAYQLRPPWIENNGLVKRPSTYVLQLRTGVNIFAGMSATCPENGTRKMLSFYMDVDYGGVKYIPEAGVHC